MSKYWIYGLFLVPISIEIATIGETPVELVIADFLLIISMISLIFKRIFVNSLDWKSLKFYYAFIFYTLIISTFSSLFFESLSPIAGQLRYIKSTFIILIAFYIGSDSKLPIEKQIKLLAYMYIVLLFALFTSDVLYNGAFPFGRWGGNLFNFKVYGFPNGAAAYYAICSALLFYTFDNEKRIIPKIFMLAAILLAFLLCIFSLSRNATFTFIMSLILCVIFVIRNIKIKALFIAFSSFIGISIIPFIYLNEGLISKFTSIGGADPLSGRGNIWIFAFDYIGVSPLFGYGFYSFSNWGYEIGTLHNLFLDLLYKMGVVGLILYLGVFFTPIIQFYKFKLTRREGGNQEIKLYSVMLALCFISGMSQESLSYSMNQLVMLYLCGILMANINKEINR